MIHASTLPESFSKRNPIFSSHVAFQFDPVASVGSLRAKSVVK